MPAQLQLTIRGTVGPDVVQLLVDGVAATLTGRTYAVTVPATARLVALTTIAASGRETTRMVQVTSVPGAPA